MTSKKIEEVKVNRIKKNSKDLKTILKLENKLNLSLHAMTVLNERYLIRNSKGNVVENPEQMFRRVAKYVAKVEKKEKKKWENEFFEVMKNLEFLPNTPCLTNAGTTRKQLSACYVLDLPDSIKDIFETLKESALIFQSGAGVGYSFSKIRAEGSLIKTSNREASGPVSFMYVFDKAAEIMKKGGIRRAAMMGVLDITHLDIFEFIGAKENGDLKNFNISVAITDDFMRKVLHGQNYWLKDDKGRNVKKFNSREVYDYICKNAWENGEPGILFIDEINRKNNLKKLNHIYASNPCGEVPLFERESCCLGSVNLSKFTRKGDVNWVKLAKAVKIGVRFLDNVVTVNKYPSKEIELMCLSNRKIGLGVMGWADMLIELGIPYDSKEAVKLADSVMKFINKKAREESEKLAREKGAFPNFKRSSLKKRRRNASLLAIAPTGSISIIAGCSSGIEPIFAVAYMREILNGMKLFEVNKRFEELARYTGFYKKGMMRSIANKGSLKGVRSVPKQIKELFMTSLEIPLERHIEMQAAFQKNVDNAVSKTINLPKKASIGDVKRAYMLAWKNKCKGITVYRYGSREKQVLYLGNNNCKKC
ncbi:adenosylcobalamin-dependent ribonucleoside-diphosphate reductase [archaeon]|nr:adenosylcobalamin-dependent ribonucleoside-diphosphate reductase [archaeon]MBT3731399.1 adenosylcobalamin-dependent ribonucleoside-diphosphate reductase [archaeon]MBT4670298.1 adenosylcobalamin-dependent ribonucleoside-diphosphate reductase [archaeon]MBT5029684.1 adenosylcobalamin-dependent ribonucleoside-diphosphate reductase [archaeon]MBT5287567.1 adenosylcobalamin-dependent ribonucleoside-diphosphate reductase [archaeon]